MNARQIFLLDYLLKQHDYLSANQLSEKYGVSTKTVYQDIDKLNSFLEESELKSRIIKVPRKGIMLSAEEEKRKIHSILVKSKYETGVQDYSPEYREAKLVKRLFINQVELDLYDFAEEMYVTESTVHRDIDKLECNLSQFNLKIRIKHDHLYIDGDEWNIRKALQVYVDQEQFLKSEEKLEYFFSKEDIEVCKEAISRLCQKYNSHFSEEYLSLLLLECLVLKKRTENNSSYC